MTEQETIYPPGKVWLEDTIIRILRDGPVSDEEAELERRILKALEWRTAAQT
jgi:hypothetical protein